MREEEEGNSEPHILEKMACQLIDMLPLEKEKENGKGSRRVQKLNLVLDGGLFNGSYMIGSLYYLRVLEKRKKIKVKRISAVSIGVICGLFYLINKMEYFDQIYRETYFYLKEKNDLQITLKIIDKMIEHLPANVLEIVNHRLYISYYDMQKGRKFTHLPKS